MTFKVRPNKTGTLLTVTASREGPPSGPDAVIHPQSEVLLMNPLGWGGTLLLLTEGSNPGVDNRYRSLTADVSMEEL